MKLAAEVSDLSEDMRQILNLGVHRLTQRIALLLQEGQQQGSIPTHLDPFKTAQVMYQLWLGAALMTKLAQDKAQLHLALDTTKQLLQPIQE